MHAPTSKIFVVIALVSGLSAGWIHAQDFGYTVPVADQTDGNGNYGEAAIEFTLKQNIMLTELGYAAIQINSNNGDTPQINLYNVTSGIVAPVGATGTIPTNTLKSTGSIAGVLTSNPGAGAANTAAPTYVSTGVNGSITTELFAGQTYLIAGPGYWVPVAPQADITVDPQNTGAFSSFLFLSIGGSATGGGFIGGGTNAGFFDTTYNTAPNIFTSLAPISGTGVNLPVSVDFEFSVLSAPEPSAYTMFGFGLAALAFVLYRRSITK